MEREKLVIPSTMYPPAEMHEVTGRDGKQYLLKNDVMFTGYRHSRAEFSDFFLAIRGEAKLFGLYCPLCRHVIIPPFMLRCPSCNFAEMRKTDVWDTGLMDHSPVITMFPPSRFKNEVPFCTGYVHLAVMALGLNRLEAMRVPTSSAMQVRLRTTTGSIRPGIFKKDSFVKIVFSDERKGDITEIFAVPASELSEEQLNKSPLFESDIAWNAKNLELPPATIHTAKTRSEIKTRLLRLAELVAQSPRALDNLNNWKRNVEIRTSAGYMRLAINNGLKVDQKRESDISFVLTAPEKFNAWLHAAIDKDQDQVPALTDLVMDGSLVLSITEMETITRLDRIPRSLRRDGVV